MSPEKEKRLFERFNFFKPDKSPQETLMCFGFECDDGWFDVIWELCEDVERLLENVESSSEYESFEIIQVKEKFAELRVYTNWSTHSIDERIQKAEEDSRYICEHCGMPGEQISDGGWMFVSCKNCETK